MTCKEYKAVFSKLATYAELAAGFAHHADCKKCAAWTEREYVKTKRKLTVAEIEQCELEARQDIVIMLNDPETYDIVNSVNTD